MKTKIAVANAEILPKALTTNSLSRTEKKLPPGKDLLISSSHKATLRAVARQLGISPESCLDDAIEDWLNIVAPARIEEVSQCEKPLNVIAFPQQKDGLIEDVEIPCDRFYRI